MDIIETQFSSATAYNLGSFRAIVFQGYQGTWHGMVEQTTPRAYADRTVAVLSTRMELRGLFLRSDEGRLAVAEGALREVRMAILDGRADKTSAEEVIDQILAILD